MIQGTQTTKTLYLDGFQYKNNRLEFFPTPEGYVNVLDKYDSNYSQEHLYDYVYNYTDHLGNIRLSYTDANRDGIVEDYWDPLGIDNVKEILEENHYYPFGLKHNYNATISKYQKAQTNDRRRPKQIIAVELDYKYKYNAKELQDELGLDWYDYGARNYDASLGRWMNVDPFAERYAPYNPYSFVANNPIGNQEVDGRWWFSKNKKNNTLHYGANTVRVSGTSQYAFKMSSVRAVHKKQTGWASYMPLIGNLLNGSAMAQKLEDPSMNLDKGDMASLFLGAYFKGTRKLIGASGALKGGAKIALDISETSTKLISQIASSPELKESWVELAVMEHFAGATSDGGNDIGTLSNTQETDYTTIFRFSEDFVGELQGVYGNEYDSLKDTSGKSRESYIENKVQRHMKQMFENKKTEIMNKLNE